MLSAFQEQYAERWAFEGNPRECAAYGIIRAIFGLEDSDIELTGKGAMSSRLLDDPSESRPDFYVPALDRWFEATGSGYTVDRSASRCIREFGLDGPHVFVREGKVEAFERQGIADKVIFVHVAEMEGDVRFIPLKMLNRARPVSGFERGGRDRYLALPWLEAKKPCQLYEVQAWLEQKRKRWSCWR